MRRTLAALGVLLSAATLSEIAHADESDLQALLNETIITTASKSAERGSTAPATSTVLTADDIRTFGVHSISEAIDFLSLGAMTSDTMRAVDIGSRGEHIYRDQQIMRAHGREVSPDEFRAFIREPVT